MKNLKWLFLVILVFLIFRANSQNVDSLLNLIEKEDDQIKQVDLINNLVEVQLKNNEEPDSNGLIKAISLADKNYYKKGKAHALKNRGVWEIKRLKYKIAEEDLLTAKTIYQSIGDTQTANEVENELSILYERIGNYDKALESLKLYLDYAVSIDDKKLMAKANNNFGNVYRKIGDYQKATESYINCLELDSLTNDTVGLAIDYINLAELYRDKGELSKAVSWSLEGLKKSELLNNDLLIFWSFTTLGLINKDISDKENALKYLSNATTQALSMKDEYLIGVSYSNISQLYETINLDSSIIFLEKVYYFS